MWLLWGNACLLIKFCIPLTDYIVDTTYCGRTHFNFYFIFMCMGVLPAHMSVSHACAVPGACGGWKRVCDPLKLESKIVIRGYVGAGNGALVLWENRQCSAMLSHLPSPQTPRCSLDNVQHLQGLLLCVKSCYQDSMGINSPEQSHGAGAHVSYHFYLSGKINWSLGRFLSLLWGHMINK